MDSSDKVCLPPSEEAGLLRGLWPACPLSFTFQRLLVLAQYPLQSRRKGVERTYCILFEA